MLNNESIYSKVTEALLQASPEAAEIEIHPETPLISDLHIDSMKVAELSILLEQSFNYPIFLPDLLATMEDPYDLTVASLVSFVSQTIDQEDS